MVCALVRTVLYLAVHAAITDIDLDHTDNKGLGSFFAEYIENTTGSTIMTLLVMGTLFAFYISNLYIIKQMNRMIDFIKAQNEELVMSQAIPRNIGSITMPSRAADNAAINGSLASGAGYLLN